MLNGILAVTAGAIVRARRAFLRLFRPDPEDDFEDI